MEYIKFGNYPQTEIVGDASQSGCTDKAWAADGDYIVDADLYKKLQNAEWDEDGDAVIDGVKYRKVTNEDVTYSPVARFRNYYNWDESVAEHYFKFEPINWIVVKKDGDDALLVAEKIMDTQKYHEELTSVEWCGCTARSWLNAYADSNILGYDYSEFSFINTAFTEDEQKAINTTKVVTDDLPHFNLEGGDDTEDKIFNLSVQEYEANADIIGTAKSSTYAKSLGLYINTDEPDTVNATGRNVVFGVIKNGAECCGISAYWLRNPGFNVNQCASIVNKLGRVSAHGHLVYDPNNGIRPAMNVSLKAIK